jgi:hypothetical protein
MHGDSYLDVSNFDEGQNSPFSYDNEDWERFIDELCNCGGNRTNIG